MHSPFRPHIAALVLLAAATLTHASVTSPNILLIISDDQAWNDYGFMGHPHLATPHLDRLAAASLTFERGYSPVPLCRPSLASIATGCLRVDHAGDRISTRSADQAMSGLGERRLEESMSQMDE